MTSARHRAPARHAARRAVCRLAGLAVVASTVTATAVTVGVVGSDDAGLGDSLVDARASLGSIDLDALAARDEHRLSRSAQRTAPRVSLDPAAVEHDFATEAAPLWREPRRAGGTTAVLETGDRIAVTGQRVGRWVEVLLREGTRTETTRWVNSDLLSDTKPEPEPEPETVTDSGTESETDTGTVVAGLSSAPCADGSAIESGLTDAADRVYRAVCAAFPQPTTYGGLDPHGEHVDGRAIDIMISGDVGWQIAEFLRANAGALGIRDIIYSQRIWTPDQAASGWRPMSDRGSVTANHYDHVHVAVY